MERGHNDKLVIYDSWNNITRICQGGSSKPLRAISIIHNINHLILNINNNVNTQLEKTMKPPFPEGTITSFNPGTPYFFYSNFYPFSINYQGITYPTTEHAYQAAKVQDTDTRMLIMRQPTSAQAKKMGKIINVRLDWDAIKFQVMRDILNLKFVYGSVLAAKLRSSGNAYIIEGNYWHDLIWGQCSCRRHNWEGENKLGLLLMEVRSELERTARPSSQGRVQVP